jgi:hypothetical protein
MSEAITRFFESLHGRGYDHGFRAEGVTRVEIRDGDRVDYWVVSARRGELSVSKDAQLDVDTVMVVDSALMDRMVRGEMNGLAALLRGMYAVRGDYQLALMLERFMPGPPGAKGPQHLNAGKGDS